MSCNPTTCHDIQTFMVKMSSSYNYITLARILSKYAIEDLNLNMSMMWWDRFYVNVGSESLIEQSKAKQYVLKSPSTKHQTEKLITVL